MHRARLRLPVARIPASRTAQLSASLHRRMQRSSTHLWTSSCTSGMRSGDSDAPTLQTHSAATRHQSSSSISRRAGTRHRARASRTMRQIRSHVLRLQRFVVVRSHLYMQRCKNLRASKRYVASVGCRGGRMCGHVARRRQPTASVRARNVALDRIPTHRAGQDRCYPSRCQARLLGWQAAGRTPPHARTPSSNPPRVRRAPVGGGGGPPRCVPPPPLSCGHGAGKVPARARTA